MKFPIGFISVTAHKYEKLEEREDVYLRNPILSRMLQYLPHCNRFIICVSFKNNNVYNLFTIFGSKTEEKVVQQPRVPEGKIQTKAEPMQCPR